MLLALEALRALALLSGAYLTAHWLDAVFLRGAQPGDTAPVLLVLFFVMGAAAGARREETRLLARLAQGIAEEPFGPIAHPAELINLQRAQLG